MGYYGVAVLFHHEDHFDGLCTLVDQFYAFDNFRDLQLVGDHVL